MDAYTVVELVSCCSLPWWLLPFVATTFNYSASVAKSRRDIGCIVSSRLDYGTVMRYCTALLTGCTVAYSPSRMPWHDLYPGYGTVITSSPLVTCTTAVNTVQDCCPDLPVSKRPSTVVLGRWLSTRVWRPSTSTLFVWLCDLCRPTYTDHLQRPVFCRCRPTSAELFAIRTKTIWQSRTV